MKLTALIAALCLTTAAWAKKPEPPKEFRLKTVTEAPAERDYLQGFVSFMDFIGNKQATRPIPVKNLFDCAQESTMVRFGIIRTMHQNQIVEIVNVQIEEMNKTPDAIPDGFAMDHLSMRVSKVLGKLLNMNSRETCQNLVDQALAEGATPEMIDEAIAYGDGLGIMSSLWGMGFKLEN